MNWTTLDFGKYEGKSLPQVLFVDPDWFFWAVQDDVFKGRTALKAQAADIQAKATQIRVPQSGAEKLVVEHYIHASTMRYSHFIVVPQDKPSHQGASSTIRCSLIDMSLPRRISKYDKLGAKMLVASLKDVYFGSKSVRMTKERCEHFFDTQSNFL